MTQEQSVLYFNLTVKIGTEEQYQKIAKALLKKFPYATFNMSCDWEVNKHVYYISIGEEPWGANLAEIARILKRYDKQM